ncbi:MAG: DUF998 domain-containing protein [Promethearchaeota archaeon]
MEGLDKFYEKIHGSYFSFIGLAIFIIGLIIAISVEPNFSFFAIYISDLGAPTNSAYVIFDICWFITGIFIIFFLLFFTRYLQEKGANTIGTWITFILGVLSAGGIMGLAIFNSIDFYFMHFISELLFFFTGICYLIIYALLESKIPKFPKLQVIFNLIVMCFFVLYLILLIADKIHPGLYPEFKCFSEWLFLFSDLFWFFENGIFTLKVK